jgi:undecaprenyl-diphosphatase
MTILEALILGLLQGLTEFLPVSSSGHIELGKILLNVEESDNLTFTVLVHGATVLSILVVFWKDIVDLLKGLLKFSWNDETKFVSLIAVSMIPVGVVGVLFEEEIEQFFSGEASLVGAMLLVTAVILLWSDKAPDKGKSVGFGSALIIGIAQTIAVLPGISRSGSTIGAALLLGIDRYKATRFSFLMVVPPILGATLLKVKDLAEAGSTDTSVLPLVVGFIAAFGSGLLACRWMIRLVRNGKLKYFAWYCIAIGLIAIISAVIN